ncbi:MAG: hypothetical protein RO009_14450 [Pseudorhodoplanes sp.]|jgi:hypothetical protein|nr:hypothetical protein [Pseudorhodoplanes sp.]
MYTLAISASVNVFAAQAQTPSPQGAATKPTASQATKPTQAKPAQSTKLQAQAAASTGVAQRTSQFKKEPIKEPVTSKACPRVAGKPYFVEFRSRTAASYGHTFVFHGTLGSGRGFASFKVAGLHPKGDDPATYIQGHWAPVEAETGVSYGDLDEQYLTARFCVAMTKAEYDRTAAYIRHLQATTKTWHAPTYNCNSFAADIAKHIGLDTPNPNAYLPETFIKRLAEDNTGKKGGLFSSFSSMQGGQNPAR